VTAVVAVIAVGVLALAACGDDDDDAPAASGACTAIEHLVEPTEGHVLPGGTVNYQHHPPTSGRHLADLPARGVHDAPIEEVSQVYALEGGFVILQYGPALPADGVAALQARADGQPFVIVAPAATPIDDGKPVALTAWENRQLCDAVSAADVDAFVTRFAGKGPGND
jgi:hypothetical protein